MKDQRMALNLPEIQLVNDLEDKSQLSAECQLINRKTVSAITFFTPTNTHKEGSKDDKCHIERPKDWALFLRTVPH